MDTNLKKCLEFLRDNDTATLADALKILLRLCDNILSFPDDSQHRKIRVDDSRITENLLRAFGAIECLFEMGFVEDGEYFTLPPEASLSRIRQIQKILHDFQSKTRPAVPKSRSEQSQKISGKGRRQDFLQSIANEFKHVLIYENVDLQNRAREVIPIEKLQIGAMQRMRQFQKEIKQNNAKNGPSAMTEYKLTVDDFLLVELTDWFKNDFFKWVDTPDCDICGKPCKYDRTEYSTDPKVHRTEIHKCHDCHIEVKFPRYVDPGILLKTRCGRCGEWANAFTLLCRTLNFDARYVHDRTDHVWTEIWSIAQNRWIHVDPCENVIDRPLMYERGWNKKLTYVIAYSKDEIQDVTWRYTRDQPEVMKRRLLCVERKLCELICRLNDERQNSLGYSEARKNYVTKRRAMELVEFLPAPPGTKIDEESNEEYEGRSSGSLAWRMSRGETQTNPTESRIWKVPQFAKKLELRYYSAKDEYETWLDDEKLIERLSGWQNGINLTEGAIFRKVEHDWKIAYLARSPGQKKGLVAWCIEIPESVSVKLFELHAKCAIFQSGKVGWKVEGSYQDPKRSKIILSIENCENFQTSDLDGVTKILIIAELENGDGDLSWQHAQLFRQNLTDRDERSMTISIRTC